MHFNLVDHVLEQSPDRIVTLKQVSSAEEYLQDHFPTFPVLPGVLMLEAMVQAARLLGESMGRSRMVLGGVRALKYGRFVKPGAALRVEVTRGKTLDDGRIEFKGEGRLLEPDAPTGVEPPVAVSGKIIMRDLRFTPAAQTR